MKRVLISFLLLLIALTSLPALSNERLSFLLAGDFYLPQIESIEIGGDTWRGFIGPVKKDGFIVGPNLGIDVMHYTGGDKSFFRFGYGIDVNVAATSPATHWTAGPFAFTLDIDLRLDFAFDFRENLSMLFGLGAGFGAIFGTPENFSKSEYDVTLGLDTMGILEFQVGMEKGIGLGVGAALHLMLPISYSFGGMFSQGTSINQFITSGWPGNFFYQVMPFIDILVLF